MRHYIGISILLSLFAVPWLASKFPEQANLYVFNIKDKSQQLASVIFNNPRTIAQLQTKYSNNVTKQKEKIRILIVPGHEPHYGGAEYGQLKERDLVVDLSENLADFLKISGKYEVILTRDKDSWNQIFASYFDNNTDLITEWKDSYKTESNKRLSTDPNIKPVAVIHNDIPNNVALRLYGIVKWANENNVDIVIHAHLNDYKGRKNNTPGKYSGLSIYTPELIYANGSTTRALSEAILDNFRKFNTISDYPPEVRGIVDERELIAIGAHNTADSASLLIEYGYIYESQFTSPEIRNLALKDLAYQTYLGIENFFNPLNKDSNLSRFDTLILPYYWGEPINEKDQGKVSIYALQTALTVEGLYPPIGKNKNDCPRSGTIGQCTLGAIENFQKKYNISGEKGIGPLTLKELNRIYSLNGIFSK